MDRGSFWDNKRKNSSASPKPRQISKTRVNEERPLLLRNESDRNHGTNGFLAVGKSQKAYRGVNGSSEWDNESIDYRSCVSVDMDPNSTSIQSLDPEDEAPSEYYPTETNVMEELEWSDVLPYYLPFLSWLPHYSASYFVGDLIGGLSLVFFQLPLSISYATSLAHVHLVCGLYSLTFAPLVYLFFGSVPHMIVGPEAAISLVIGQNIDPFLHHMKNNGISDIAVVSAITFISGITLFAFGLVRFGFLDNVLNASLLKGFITGVGVVMVIDALIVTLGLKPLLDQISADPNEMDIHSPIDKCVFLLQNFTKFDPLTTKISASAFLMIIFIRVLKARGQKLKMRFASKFVYVPEILIVFVLFITMCHRYRWDKYGVQIIGKVINDDSNSLMVNPIAPSNWYLLRKFVTCGFLCAMLGFLESTTAQKALGTQYDLPISTNRELIAMGSINILGSLVGALPAFGGYGRSKINSISAKTTFSGAIMGICTLITLLYLLDGLYFVPKCILSVITATIGISLVEEAPSEIWFHFKSKGYDELITFFIVVTTTFCFSMEAGVSVGLLYSLIRVIRKSAKSRIQILGRIPGSNTFVNAYLPQDKEMNDLEYDRRFSIRHRHHPNEVNLFVDNDFSYLNTSVIEEIEGCLIVKVPEPLFFVNANDMKSRLKRVELFGSTTAHPGSRRSRSPSMTKYMIFDLEGMVEIDSSAAKILYELIRGYQQRGIFTFFVRVAQIRKLRDRLVNTGIMAMLMSDLEIIKKSYYHLRDGIDLSQNIKNQDQDMKIGYSASRRKLLTESSNSPYFDHITHALEMIDGYDIKIKSIPFQKNGFLDT